ncbi:hypothetical protein GCM10009868_18340 [Terrabacter aerolatus]
MARRSRCSTGSVVVAATIALGADVVAAEARVPEATASAAPPPSAESTRRRAGEAPGSEPGRCASMLPTVRTGWGRGAESDISVIGAVATPSAADLKQESSIDAYEVMIFI